MASAYATADLWAVTQYPVGVVAQLLRSLGVAADEAGELAERVVGTPWQRFED